MTDWDELIDDVEYYTREVCNAQKWGMKSNVRKTLAECETTLRAAIAELERQNAILVEDKYNLKAEIEQVTATLTAQLAEANADAERLAKELHDWLVFAEANDQIYAARSGMNAMLHHLKRKEGK